MTALTGMRHTARMQPLIAGNGQGEIADPEGSLAALAALAAKEGHRGRRQGSREGLMMPLAKRRERATIPELLRELADEFDQHAALPLPVVSPDQLLKLTDLAALSGLSKRTLREAIRRPSNPLPARRIPGGRDLLVRWGDFLDWLEPACPDDDELTTRALRLVTSI